MSTCFLRPRELCSPSSISPLRRAGNEKQRRQIWDTANCLPKIEWFRQNNKICLLAQLLQLCSEWPFLKHLFRARHFIYTIPLTPLNNSGRQEY